ncbi:tetratricopeptide repeat protein, partial [Thalassobaculum sp.]|uniref:tetratricopeptide repeat protein n=1 Tax=Thalassobaculum sp. TaxID=2022740 RepID=UPI0032EDD90C
MSAGQHRLDLDIDTHLEAARAAWRDGRRDQARRMWHIAVAAQPGVAAPYVNLAGAGSDGGKQEWLASVARTLRVGDPVLQRNLGVLAQQRGQTEKACRCLRRALLLAPDDTQSLGVLAKLPSGCEAGREADDERWSLRAALTDPGNEARWTAALTRLLHAGREREAMAWAAGIPIPVEAYSVALLRLVAHCLSLGAGTETIVPILDRLIRLDPYDVGSRIRKVIVERRRGNPASAIRHGRRAVLVVPGSIEAVGALASELVRGEQYEEAVALFRRQIKVNPERRPEALENLGAALVRLDAEAEAVTVLREALVCRPQSCVGYLNLSTIQLQSPDLDAAARYGRQAVITGSQSPDAHYSLGSIRRHQGKLEEARTLLNAATALEDRPAFRYVQAMLELGDGDPVAGLDRYEARWDIPNFSAYRKLGSEPTLTLPVWQGEIRPDATLAIWGEQGVGDELWFAGYLSWAVRRVGRVVLEVAENLVPLFTRSFPEVEVRARYGEGTEAAMAAADLQIPLGGLMRLCGAAIGPVPTGYLYPDPARIAQLHAMYRAGRPGGRVVGIAWRSVKPLRGRSFEAPLGEWGALFALDDTVFVSLQYGDVAEDVSLVAERFGRKLVCSPEIDAYRDLDGFAAQVAAVDHVVSIANSTVALAHGLGKRVEVIARTIQDDWRYARRAPATRWLPTAGVTWQTNGQDWATPIRQIAERIGGGGGGGPPPPGAGRGGRARG